MAINYEYFEGSKNPKDITDCVKNNIEFNKEHPYYFKPEGITVFTGSQGEGKTLSAVQMTKKILKDYPRCILITNTKIEGVSNLQLPFEDLEDLEIYNNEEYGIIFFVDEIQNYLSSLMSKNIPLSTIINLTQQRKQRKLIIATSQVYSRMAKPLREQVKNVVICNKYLFFIQVNWLIDSMKTREVNGDLKLEIKKRFLWFHSPKLYKTYDTYNKVYGLMKKDNDSSVVIVDKDSNLVGT